jgi:spore coat polysaccharide biosynthesis predicted glycosyltransferase SpsG
MIAFCIESSHQRGMGHIFRAFLLLDHLKSENEPALFLINDHAPSVKLLKERGIPFEIIDLTDQESDWESRIIFEYEVDVWLNDRLNTDIRHAMNVKKNGISLITFDDRGSGAELSDLHFAALVFEKTHQLKGTDVFTGIDYLILNPEIARYRRLREKADNVLVSLGGSDTYGVTLNTVRFLKNLQMDATIHLGPSFNHREQLDSELDNSFEIITSVPSLIREFFRFDLLIAGGGITPFEANASGLPCIVVANETHEIEICRFLSSKGSSHYLGFRDQLSADRLEKAFQTIDIGKMSSSGMASYGLNGAKNTWCTIRDRING